MPRKGADSNSKSKSCVNDASANALQPRPPHLPAKARLSFFAHQARTHRSLRQKQALPLHFAPLPPEHMPRRAAAAAPSRPQGSDWASTSTEATQIPILILAHLQKACRARFPAAGRAFAPFPSSLRPSFVSARKYETARPLRTSLVVLGSAQGVLCGCSNLQSTTMRCFAVRWSMLMTLASASTIKSTARLLLPLAEVWLRMAGAPLIEDRSRKAPMVPQHTPIQTVSTPR